MIAGAGAVRVGPGPAEQLRHLFFVLFVLCYLCLFVLWLSWFYHYLGYLRFAYLVSCYDVYFFRRHLGLPRLCRDQQRRLQVLRRPVLVRPRLAEEPHAAQVPNQ